MFWTVTILNHLRPGSTVIGLSCALILIYVSVHAELEFSLSCVLRFWCDRRLDSDLQTLFELFWSFNVSQKLQMNPLRDLRFVHGDAA